MLSVSIVKQLDGFTLDAAWTGTERVVALLGPSGSGKTLTLSCLAGIVTPDRGRIELDGAVLFDSEGGIDVATRERHLGYVLQGYALFPHLTVAQNIGYGLLGWPKERRADRVVEVLGRLGLADLAHRYPRELSGGQQQRVALGRALAPDPTILLLDEPLSALDAPLRRQLRAELVTTLQDWGKTTVLVTHDVAEAYELATQIVIYDHGRVLQSASRRDAVRRPSSEAVARIMGLRNILRGTVLRATSERIWLQWHDHVLEAVNPPGSSFLPLPGRAVPFHIRPELVRLIRKDRPGPDPDRHRNLLEAVIVGDTDLGTAHVLAVRIGQPGDPAQGDADFEIEMSPLVYEMLEVDHHRRWQLSIQPAGIHVLPDGTGGAGVPQERGAPVGEPEQMVASSLAEGAERRVPRAAALAGMGVGVVGGLLGLGGAEFRLPILVGYFRYGIRRAISLNLAVSLVTVLAAASSRIFIARQIPDASALPIGIAMMLGGMLGAAIGSQWLARVSERRLHAAVRALLMGIGLLLIVESAVTWQSAGLPFSTPARAIVAGSVGVLIGMVSTLLGVAGGELIIPTLVLLFAVPIRAAGTLSLLISIPTILVGLARHRARGAFEGLPDLRHLVVPMALGTILGGVVGGAMVVFVPTGAVKLLLGSVLIASAAKVFAVDRPLPARRK